jgi:epoxyqueuosine reductase
MEDTVRDEIVRFVLERPENRRLYRGERGFDEPLVGFASAEDPLFAEYKRVIGPFHRASARS